MWTVLSPTIHPRMGQNYKVHMMANRKQGDPNPWIVGGSTYLRFMGAFVEGICAQIAMHEIKDKEAMEKGAAK